MRAAAEGDLAWVPRIAKGAGPVYLAIADALAEDILSGTLGPGMRLPPQRTLADALDIDFTNGVRHVRLARGEAYFDVVHDPSRPFTVVAGSGRVSDVGTAFAVRRTGEGAEVIVARGEVEVTPSLPGAAPEFLGQNQALSYDASRATPVRPRDAAQALSWVRGQLILDNRLLADSVDQINHYYQGRLVLLNARAGGQRINAVIDLNRIDDWLQALDKTHTVHVARVGSLVFIY